MIAAVVTTYNRPAALARTLPQVCALGWPVLVVDDGGREFPSAATPVFKSAMSRQVPCCLMQIPTNRGLACAINVGVSYWLADPAVEWISVFQDDVDVRPDLPDILGAVAQHLSPMMWPLYTGHDAAEHAAETTEHIQTDAGRIDYVTKSNCRATHLHATRDYWMSVLPVPTVSLGAPHRLEGQIRGRGSNVDWWIVRNAPRSVVQTGRRVVCIPGLVRTFLWKRADSTWDNLAPEEPPL